MHTLYPNMATYVLPEQSGRICEVENAHSRFVQLLPVFHLSDVNQMGSTEKHV